MTLLTPQDLHLFNEGSHLQLYDKLGAHPMTQNGVAGTYFAVWAPNAWQVIVMGDFNNWDKTKHLLRPVGQSGIWEGFVPGIGPGVTYKYHIVSRQRNYRVDKADPFAFCSETPPHTASRVWDLSYEWHDREWMLNRGARQALDAPMSIYELQLGS